MTFHRLLRSPLSLLPPLLFALLLALGACKGSQEEPAGPPAIEPAPPAPPITESFEGEPRLSLFPRVGDFRPAEGETERQQFWATYLDHLVRTSGVVQEAGRGGGRALAVRNFPDIACGWFSPLAVEPGVGYTVRFAFRGELPEGARAGVGVLEYDEFLWIGEQFTEELATLHQVGAREGIVLKEAADWREESFTFTPSPRTRMVHLVFFREGTADRKPVLFDDISVERAPSP